MTNTDTIADAAAREVEATIRRQGEIGACELFAIVRQRLGVPEEKCSLEIFAGMGRLIRRGHVRCNTASADLSEITYGVDTVLSPQFPEMVN